jgi:hypothetical protein
METNISAAPIPSWPRKPNKNPPQERLKKQVETGPNANGEPSRRAPESRPILRQIPWDVPHERTSHTTVPTRSGRVAQPAIALPTRSLSASWLCLPASLTLHRRSPRSLCAPQQGIHQQSDRCWSTSLGCLWTPLLLAHSGFQSLEVRRLDLSTRGQHSRTSVDIDTGYSLHAGPEKETDFFF